MKVFDHLMLRGRILRWARENRGAAPFAAEYVGKEIDWPADEVALALRSCSSFRCVHVQGETEFFRLVADLPAACR